MKKVNLLLEHSENMAFDLCTIFRSTHGGATMRGGLVASPRQRRRISLVPLWKALTAKSRRSQLVTVTQQHSQRMAACMLGDVLE